MAVTIDSIDPVEDGGAGADRQSVVATWSMFRLFSLWRRRRVTRIHLAALTPYQLKDIGLTKEEAQREIRRSRLLPIDRAIQPPF